MYDNVQSIMEQLGHNEFLLPVGYTDKEGVLHRKITLRPMTGQTEEAIANPKVRDNGAKLLTELIFNVVVSLGTLPKVTKEIIRDLTTVDRDFILVKNAQVSLGDDITFIDKCKECRGKNEVSVNLENLEIKYLSDDDARELSFDLPIGYRDREGKVHKSIIVSFPTGRVQEQVFGIVRSNPAQATTMMFQYCTKKLGDLPFVNPDVFKNMYKKDRDYITKKLGEIEQFVGVNFNVELTCSECGETYTTSIPITSLLGE